MNENYSNSVSAVNPKEKLHTAIESFMQIYNDLPIHEQVDLFGLLKETVLKHRTGMLNDSGSDLDMMKARHEDLAKGFETIKSL